MEEEKYKPPDLNTVYTVTAQGQFVGKCRVCKYIIKGTLEEIKKHNCNGEKESNMDPNN